MNEKMRKGLTAIVMVLICWFTVRYANVAMEPQLPSEQDPHLSVIVLIILMIITIGMVIVLYIRETKEEMQARRERPLNLVGHMQFE